MPPSFLLCLEQQGTHQKNEGRYMFLGLGFCEFFYEAYNFMTKKINNRILLWGGVGS